MDAWPRRLCRTKSGPARRAVPAAHRACAADRLEPRTLLNGIVTVPGAADLMWDSARDLLYVTSNNTIQRYDPAAGQFLAPLGSTPGVTLNGLDITPDGSAVYAAGAANNAPTLVRFDLASGAATARAYGPAQESGFDVSIDARGRGTLSNAQRFSFGNLIPLYHFDAATGGVSVRADPAGGVYSGMRFARAGDRSVALAQEAPSFAPFVSLLDGASDAFSARINTHNAPGTSAPSAANADGSRFAYSANGGAVIFDRSFRTVTVLPGVGEAGMAFAPSGNEFYGVSHTADVMVAYDTVTWREKYRLPLGFDLTYRRTPGEGTTAVSDDGTKLFLLINNGVRIFDLPQPTGQAARLEVTPATRLTPAGETLSFTVRAWDAAGEVANGYRGTIDFTSSDPAAGLPASYTFTAADAGVKTFAVTLATPGAHTVGVGDAADPLLAAATPTVAVHGGVAAFAPVSGPRDLVYDPVRDAVYVTTSGGTVERFDVGAGRLLPPVHVGTPLNGVDITPDGAALYVADAARGLAGGFVRRVDLGGLGVESLSYADTLAVMETDTGAWDVSIANNGKAIVSVGQQTGLHYEVRDLTLATGRFTSRRDPSVFPSNSPTFSPQGVLARPADRSAVLLGDLSSPGRLYAFDAATDAVAYWANALSGNGPATAPMAASRDGRLYAMANGHLAESRFTDVYTHALERVRQLPGIDGGIVFDPVRDTLYGVSAAADAVVAFDTNTWRERYRVPVGEDVKPPQSNLGPGNMAVNADGTKLFLLTPGGLRVVDLPKPSAAQPAYLEIAGLPPLVKVGVPVTFTVTARDLTGDVAAGYRGTVSFTSSDGSAALPGQYTFTAADAGAKTFTLTFGGAGTHTVTAADAASAATGASSPVAVHAGDASLVPIAGAQDVVYDAARNRLYITTAGGTVERVDLATRTMLSPVNVGSPLFGADIAPGGSFLYAADGLRTPTQASVRKVDLADGSASRLAFPAAFEERGVWDVAAGADGSVLFSLRMSLGASVRELDPATGTVTPRPLPQDIYGAFTAATLARGADRSVVMLNPIDGYAAWYNVTADAWERPGYPYDADYFGGTDLPNALSPNASLVFGHRSYWAPGPTPFAGVFDRNLKTVVALAGIDGGAAFDARRAVFYGINSTTNELVAFDTVGWSEKYRVPVGEDVARAVRMGPGNATVSDDGSSFFLVTPGGVRIIDLRRPTSDAGGFVVSGFPRLTRTGVVNRFTVRAFDQQGNPLPGFRGTVRFASTDPAANLPPEYTFTAADDGWHTFEASFGTAGVHSLTVRDAADGTAVGTQREFRIHAGDPGLLPIPARRDLVYDPHRNRLYVTTATGWLERYDLNTQTLLDPVWAGGVGLKGADITADGSAVYAAAQHSRALAGTDPTPGSIVKFGLGDADSDAVTVARLDYPLQFLDGDAWDLAMLGTDRALFSSSVLGSGSAAVRQINLATDAITLSGTGASGDSINNAELARGGDRSAVFISDRAVSGNPVKRFGAAEGRVTATKAVVGTVTSVSRDGRYAVSWINDAALILDRNLNVVARLPFLDGGAFFDPNRDVLYGVIAHEFSGTVVAYDTQFWQRFWQAPIPDGYRWFSSLNDGVMAAGGDGRWLFVSTPGGVRAVAVPEKPNTGVAGVHVFYNRSALDNNDPAMNPADDAAVAPDKRALRMGEAAGAANVTAYARGINGVMIDVHNYPAPDGVWFPHEFDFKVGRLGEAATWVDAPAFRATVRRGAGVNGSDRITFTWPDGAIKNTWLRITAKPSFNTGVDVGDVFYFGNLVGDTGAGGAAVASVSTSASSGTPPRLGVDAADYAATRAAVSTRRVGRGHRFDHNRDGWVNVRDLAVVRASIGRSLVLGSAPLGGPFVTPAPASSAAATLPEPARTRPPRRSLLVEGGVPAVLRR